MTVSLLDAVAAVDKRLNALDDDPVGTVVDRDQIGMVTVGFDLDADEVQQATAMGALGLVQAIASGQDLFATARGLFLNGILTGLILAEMREREAVTANAD